MTFKTRAQKRIERDAKESKLLEAEHRRFVIENALMLDFIHLVAASKRSDGTYNNCREALEQKAKAILDELAL